MAEKSAIKPRVIIHGGAGNINRNNLPLESWQDHKSSLLSILKSTHDLLHDGAEALSAATHAVKLFEDDPMYNSGKGAVFTRTGTIELEASVMVSSGRRKRGAAVSLIKHVRHPIELAAEMLRRGDQDDAGGAQGHVHVSGTSAEELAGDWGLELCEESYFWTRKRWDEHRKDLDQGWTTDTHQQDLRPDGSCWPEGDSGWNGHDYLPQGTVGCVVLDRYGTTAVATSTGGITNKLPGRIGDTPTFGAGFWAEQWFSSLDGAPNKPTSDTGSTSDLLSLDFLTDCLPFLSGRIANQSGEGASTKPGDNVHAVAMSGTGNGDSLLRESAVRTAAALSRFSQAPPVDLGKAIAWMAGRNGQLQRAAGDRWAKTGEGQGGIIGIERVNASSWVRFDFNCGGLFRAWYDDAGEAHCMVFHEDY